MTKSNPQAIDYPYPTTNTPPLTIHNTLIVCGALRRVCPCDDDRDAKEDDCGSDMSTSEKNIRRQFRNATILVLRRQKPSTNVFAACGSYARGSLGSRLWWGITEAYMCKRKSRRGLPFTHDGVGFYPWGGGVTSLGFLYQGETILNPQSSILNPLPSALRITYNGKVYMFIIIIIIILK